MPQELTLRRPDDFHVHLRDGELMRRVIGASVRGFGRVLAMPNTSVPVLTGEDAVRYRDLLLRTARDSCGEAAASFEPLMTIKLTPDTTPDTVREAAALGVTAAKLYPDGVTTNSADGVRDFDGLFPVFAAMEAADLVLCLHGELPGAPILKREARFLPTLRRLSHAFPDLRIVLEHLSSRRAVATVADLPENVAATITVHHLQLTLDDVLSGGLNPHHYCMPVAKTDADRNALLEAATSADPKFFLGTDSAPHARSSKEAGKSAAGVFSAPFALPILAQVFDDRGQLNRLEAFTSEFGARFYGLPPADTTITLVRLPPPDPQTDAPDAPVAYRGTEPLNWRQR